MRSLESYLNSQILIFLFYKLYIIIMLHRVIVRIRDQVYNMSAEFSMYEMLTKRQHLYKSPETYMQWAALNVDPNESHLLGLTPLGNHVPLSVVVLIASLLINRIWQSWLNDTCEIRS